MKICHISDTHNKHNQLEINPCDIILHSGDHSIDGYMHESRNFLDWFARQPATYKVFICGNHDKYSETNPVAFLELVRKYRKHNVIYLNNSSTIIGDYCIWGSPQTRNFGYDWAYNFSANEYIADEQAELIYGRALDTTPTQSIDIAMTHGPAYKILDKVRYPRKGKDPHVGDKVLAKYILEWRPILHQFGHIHEQYGALVEENILRINAASLSVDYSTINEPTYTIL